MVFICRYSPRLCGSSFSSPCPPCLRGEFEFEPSIHVEIKLRPVIDAGVGKPNSARIDGARSTSDGLCACESAVAEQHAGNFQGVGAVVGAPGRVVVEENLVGEIAQARGPGRAIAAAVADDQVGRQGGGVARINLVGAVDAANDLLRR